MMVRAIMIVEIAGKPPEHVKSALERHVGILNEVKDVRVHNIKVSEPREIERPGKDGVPSGEGSGMFTCFAEVDFETETFARISEIMFDFMPSSVEILNPSKVTMNLEEATSLLNNIAGRMHRYDEIAKIAKMQVQQMAQRAQLMQEELLKRDSKKEKKSRKSPAKKKTTKKKVKKTAKKK